MFRTTLSVSHLDGNRWLLTRPLVWEGRTQYFVIMGGFETDFASIPKPVRWLLDSSGGNSEAAVLHDAVWRESQRPDHPRVDPWDADGMFRSSLRDTGSSALTRGLMWFAVRAAAMVHGRFGRSGPPFVIKILQLVGMFVLGVIAALGPTLVAAIGLVVYWVANWIVAVVWQIFERRKLHVAPNWPWPFDETKTRVRGPVRKELLVIIDKSQHGHPSTPQADDLVTLLTKPDVDVTNDDIERVAAP